MSNDNQIKDVKLYKKDWKIIFDIRNENPEKYPKLADVVHELVETRCKANGT